MGFLLLGTLCDKDVDECATIRPCEHGSRCENTEGGYICWCQTGFDGTNCETNIDDCLPGMVLLSYKSYEPEDIKRKLLVRHSFLCIKVDKTVECGTMSTLIQLDKIIKVALRCRFLILLN